MDRQQINVPGAEALAKPRTRKDFLKVLAAAGVGAAGAGAAGATAFSGQAGAQSFASDTDIGNFALTLEYLEADFYQKAVASGVLSGNALAVVTNLRDHENAHVDALAGYLGDAAVAKPQITFPADAFSSQSSVLNLAITFEPVGVGAYLGAASAIQSKTVLALAGSIYGVENEHVVAVQSLLGSTTAQLTAFPEAMTKDEVLAAVAPFLGMGTMPDTGGPGLKG